MAPLSEIDACTKAKKLLLQLVSAAMIREPAVAKESASFKTMKICVDAIAKVDPEFVLKMALYVRADLGLRGSANTLAALASLNENCRPFLKAYINDLCKLPTDWIQIAQFTRDFGDGFTLPNALRKALVAAFADFDEYELGKYNKESSSKKKEKKKRELAEKEKKKKAAEAAAATAIANRRENDSAYDVGGLFGTEPDSDSDSDAESWASEDSDADEEKNNKKGTNNNKKKKNAKRPPAKPFTIKRLIEYLHISQPRYFVMCILGLRYPASSQEFDEEGLEENGKRKYEPERAGKRMRLKVPKTWETQLAERGNNAPVWQDLIDAGLPFMAMLRNLRNIIVAGVDEEHHKKILGRLENEDQIANSRQFPYRFFSAFESLKVDFETVYWQPGEKEEFLRIKNLQNLFAKQCRAGKAGNKGTLAGVAAASTRGRAVKIALRGRGGRGAARGGRGGRGAAAAKPEPVKIEPPLKPGEKPPPKKRDLPAVGLPSAALFERYNAALNTAVKHATNNNIRPISGRTYVVVVVREDLNKNVGAGGGGIASTRTYLDLALLLALMFRYGCEDPTVVFCGPNLKSTTATCDEAWIPELPRDGLLLNNLATLRDDVTKRMGTRSKNLFPYPTFQKVIDNAQPLDCVVVIDSQEDDYATPSTDSSIDLPYDNIFQMLNQLRDKVNPDLLFVSVDICGQPKAPAVSADKLFDSAASESAASDRESRESDLNVRLTGFSDSILRFVAERGESPLAYIEKIDEVKKLNVVEARKRDEEAAAVEISQKINATLAAKYRLLQSAADKRRQLLNGEENDGASISDLDIAETQFRDASFIARVASAVSSSKIDRPLSYFSSSASGNKIRSTLRCFISSTFSDMLNERRALVQEVFPTIRRVLLERGIAIQIVEVDLRWGITDAQVQRDDALNVCLNEVARCAPLFVSLVGARRGYCPTAFSNIKPLSGDVKEEDFEWLTNPTSYMKKVSSASKSSSLAANNITDLKPSADLSITRLEFLQALQSRSAFVSQQGLPHSAGNSVNPKLVVLLRDHSSVLNSGIPQNQLHWFKNENEGAASAIGNFALDISRAVANNEAVSSSYKAPFNKINPALQLHQSTPTCPVELDMTQFKQVAIEKILESVFKATGLVSVLNSRAEREERNNNNNNNKKDNKELEDEESAADNKLDSVVISEQSLQKIRSHQVASIAVGREEQTIDLLQKIVKKREGGKSYLESNVVLVSGFEGNGKSSFIHRAMWQLISGVETMKSSKKGKESTTSVLNVSPNNAIIFHHDFSFGSGTVANCVTRLVKTLITRLSLEEVITASTNTVAEALAVLPQVYALVGRRRHVLYVFLTNTGSCIDQDGLVSTIAALIPPMPSPSLSFVVEVPSASTGGSAAASGSSTSGGASGSDKFAAALRVRAIAPHIIQLPDLDRSERCQVLHMHLQTLGKALMESASKGKFVSPLLRKSESGKASYLVAAVSALALFANHDTLLNDIRQLGSTTRAIQSDLLSKLETSFGFSKNLVQDVLSTIVLSQKIGGISERDLYYSVASSSANNNDNKNNSNSNTSSSSFGSSSSSSSTAAAAVSVGSTGVQEIRRLLCILEKGLSWRNGVVDIALPALTTAITKRYLDRSQSVTERHAALAEYYLNSLPTDSSSPSTPATPQLQFAAPRSVVAMLYHALGASNQEMLEKIITNVSCLETAVQGGFLPLLFNLVDQLDFKFRVLAKKVTPFTTFLRRNQHILADYPKLTLQSASHDKSVAVRKAAKEAASRLAQLSKAATIIKKILATGPSVSTSNNNNNKKALQQNNKNISSSDDDSSDSSSYAVENFGDDISDDSDNNNNNAGIENTTFDAEDRRKQLAQKLCRAIWPNVNEHGEMDCAQTFVPSAGNGLTCITCNDAGTIFTVGCKDGNCYSYNVIDGTGKKFTAPSMVTCIFHMKNQQQQLFVGCDDGVIRIFSRDGTQTHQAVGHRRTVKQISCTPDNRTIWSASTDGTVRAWTFAGARGNNLRCVETRRGHSSPVTCVAVHQQGSGFCASGGWDGRICVWNQGNRDAQPTWVDLGKAAVRGVAFAPTMIVNVIAVTYDGQMHIYDVAAGHISASFPFAHNGVPISSISYQGDGKKLVTADTNGCAKIWRSGVNGTLFDTVTGHRLPATGIACHPTKDGNFATVSQDGSARFWEVRDVPGEPRVQALHGGTITSIATGVSHNSGALIYSASRDRTVACRPSLVEGESAQAKVTFRVLAEQAESPVVKIFGSHNKLLITAHVNGLIKAFHNGPGLGGNDALFMWQSSRQLRFAPEILCANEQDEVYFAADNHNYMLGSLKDGKVWTWGSVKQKLLKSDGHSRLVTAAAGGKSIIAIGTNDGSVQCRSYRRGDFDVMNAITPVNDFFEISGARSSPITAVSVSDESYAFPMNQYQLSFVVLAATRDGRIKFLTQSTRDNGAKFNTTTFRLSTLLGLDQSDLVAEHAFPPRPTLYATSLLVASNNRFAIGCSNGAILVGTFVYDDSPSACRVEDVSLEGLFFASSPVTALSTVTPHAAGLEVISAGRDNNQRQKIQNAGLISKKGPSGLDLCAGDSLGNLYRLQWTDVIGHLSPQQKEEFGVAAMMLSRSKSMEHHSDPNNNTGFSVELSAENENDESEDWMIEFGYCGDKALVKKSGGNELDNEDDQSASDSDNEFVGSEYNNNNNNNNINKAKPFSTTVGTMQSASPLLNNNNKDNNAKQTVSFFYKEDHSWSRHKIKKIVLTGEGFAIAAVKKRDGAFVGGRHGNFNPSEWADGKKFSVIAQNPQKSWTSEQRKKLFFDKKVAFHAACALCRDLPAAKEALREHARQTIALFSASIQM